ncbi:hypothetical protein GCM10009539_33030 [Cryptosporangium japonicum]|uniref:Uncharacterized protein n=1 Tax=Cryptosporangium japonicum TaxID=80872 RepID=A0ABN0UBD7_9ACTN
MLRTRNADGVTSRRDGALAGRRPALDLYTEQFGRRFIGLAPDRLSGPRTESARVSCALLETGLRINRGV